MRSKPDDDGHEIMTVASGEDEQTIDVDEDVLPELAARAADAASPNTPPVDADGEGSGRFRATSSWGCSANMLSSNDEELGCDFEESDTLGIAIRGLCEMDESVYEVHSSSCEAEEQSWCSDSWSSPSYTHKGAIYIFGSRNRHVRIFFRIREFRND